MTRPLLFCYSNATGNGDYNLAFSGGATVLANCKANIQAFETAAGAQIDGYQCFCSTEYTNPPSAQGMVSAAYDYAQGFVWANANGVPLSAMLTAVELASAANGANWQGNNAALQATTAGQWDTYYNQVVRQFANAGCKLLYVRVQWEQNGSWYAGWQGYTPSYQWNDWIAAFQTTANALHAAGAQYGVTVKVIWNPDAIVESGGYVPGAYPGDTYVDLIGLDLYSSYIQWGSSQVTGQAAQDTAWDTAQGTSSGVLTPAPTNGASYGWGVLDHIAFAKAHNKPMCICESGAGTGNATYGIADDVNFPPYVAAKVTQAQGEGVPVEFWSIWDGAFDLTWTFPSTYPAAIASVLGSGASVNTISFGPILNQQQVTSATITVNGSLGGYTTPPTLEYSLDNVNWNTLPSGAVVTETEFSFDLVMTIAQSYNVLSLIHI